MNAEAPAMTPVAQVKDRDDAANSGVLFVTCVAPDNPHPSGRLAGRYRCSGAHVETLFVNSKSIAAIVRDGVELWKFAGSSAFKAAIINVNGPMAQCAALVALSLRRIPMSLWVMDSYPGCLRYVTRLWPVFWFPFFCLSWIVKRYARASFLIDESFADHTPTSRRYRERAHHVPLPIPPAEPKVPVSGAGATIGIIGNIEQSWIDAHYSVFVERARKAGCKVLVATSRPVSFPDIGHEGLEIISPWPKEMTEPVFSACAYILAPLSTDRLIYSCPSKIVEAYSRGIQPVVWVDHDEWRKNQHRLVYQRCLHIEDLFADCTAYEPEELHEFSKHWSDGWNGAVTQTLRLAGKNRCRDEISNW